MAKIKLTTTQMADQPIAEYIGVIYANEVFGINAIDDLLASFSDGWGGRSGAYRRQMDSIFNRVNEELVKKANALHADAVIGLNVTINEVSGKGKQMFMACATGTAVKYEKSGNSENMSDDELVIDNNIVENEIERRRILTKNLSLITEEEWNILNEGADKKIGKLIIDKFCESTQEIECSIDKKKCLEQIYSFVRNLNFEEAASIIYPKLKEEKIRLYVMNLILGAHLFSPKEILSLISGDDNEHILAIRLLKCNKEKYTREDVIIMNEIVSKINSIPKGELITKKVLFGTSTIFRCPDGHEEVPSSDDLYKCYCVKCDKNVYGYKRNDDACISSFKKRVDVLNEYFGINR